MIERRHPLARALAFPLVALVVAACGGGNDMPELEPDQALLRVEHEINDARFITVHLENMAGTTVALGNIRRGDAESFTLLAPDFPDEMRLVAVAPNDEGREDHVVSEPFEVQAGWTINWFLPENTIEISQ